MVNNPEVIKSDLSLERLMSSSLKSVAGNEEEYEIIKDLDRQNLVRFRAGMERRVTEGMTIVKTIGKATLSTLTQLSPESDQFTTGEVELEVEEGFMGTERVVYDLTKNILEAAKERNAEMVTLRETEMTSRQPILVGVLSEKPELMRDVMLRLKSKTDLIESYHIQEGIEGEIFYIRIFLK